MNYLAYLHILIVCALLLGGCGSEPRKLAGSSGAPVDFSGNWEVDYSQSENIQEELNQMVRELNRRGQQRAPGGGNKGPTVVIGSAGGNSGAYIMALARMADMITQSPLLEIKQSDEQISVKREGNFALECAFYSGAMQQDESPLGSEVCGWDAHQLVFRIFLPEGLTIQHRLTMGPSGDRINVATTVRSSQVSTPFTLDRVFNRFDPGEAGYTCKMTLTRGRVCTTEAL